MIRYIIRYIILFLLISLQYSYAQWESAGWNNNRYINAMCVCNGTIIHAQSDFIMTSSDLGSTWQKVSDFKANISDFAQNDNSVIVFASYGEGVYLSSDCGLSWELISKGAELFSKIQISGDTIVAGDYWSANIYVSTNLGESWEVKSSGLPTAGELSINSIAFKNEILLACVGGKGNTGLYKSNDFGENWEYQGAETAGASEIYIYDDRVFMYSKGLKFSDDMGETWTAVTLGETVQTIVANADKLYVGTANGVFCSLDGGNNWIDYGLKGVNVNSLAFLNDKILASSIKALYILESPDKDWQLLDTLLNYGTVEKFAIKGGLIYTYTGANSGQKEIWVSDDIGETWELVASNTYIRNVVAFEAINDKLYLATSSIDMKTGGLQVSTDNGKSWEPDLDLPKFVEEIDEIPGMNLSISSLAEHDSYIFMGTSVGILHSTDNGETWEIRESNVDKVTSEFSNVLEFESMGSELFIRTAPLLSTTDYGETWIKKELNGLPEWSPSSLSVVGNTLVSSFRGLPNQDGVYISKDRGNNWGYIVNQNNFEYNDFGTKAVVLVFAFDTYIFASTTKANFITADEGKNWVPINEGLPDLNINDIKRVGDYLIVGTRGGFSRAKISDIADIIITSVPEELPLATQENTVYPNPTNAYLHIDKYEGSPMDYEIFDYAGKKVLSGTLNGYKIDVSALPAAAYIVVLSDETQKHTMMFIKK